MIQKNGVLKREDNCISVISTKRTTTQKDHRAIMGKKIPMNATEQICIFEVGEKTRVSGTTPNLVNTLVKIIKWLSHLGSVKIDDALLESRQKSHHNPTIKGIGL